MSLKLKIKRRKNMTVITYLAGIAIAAFWGASLERGSDFGFIVGFVALCICSAVFARAAIKH